MGKARKDAPRPAPAKLLRRKLIVPAEPAPFIQDNDKTSLLAELMAKAQMVRHDIIPGRPYLDNGTDIMTQHRRVLKRVQVKGQAKDTKSEALTFPTRRNDVSGKVAYEVGELDAFVFVHTELARFFVVPADLIVDSARYTITFGPNSHQQWENAWWVLKTEMPQ